MPLLAQKQPQKLFSKLDLQELSALFLQLTRYDNSSGQEQALIKFTAEYLSEICSCVRISKIGNVFARAPGRGKPLILSAHLDSANPAKNKKITLARGVFRSDGKTVLGADDLAGVAAILFSLRFCQSQQIVTRPLEILLSVQEEIGGRGAKAFNFKNFHSREALVVDGNSRVGTMINKSPGRYFWQGQIDSKAQKKFVLKKKFFFNSSSFLIIRQQTAQNSQLFLQGEIRFQHFPPRAKIKTILKTNFSKFFGSELKELKIAAKPYYFPYSHSRQSLRKICQALTRLKIKPNLRSSFSISDANTFNAKRISAFLIGTGVRNAHTTKETLALRELVKLTQILSVMLQSK